MTDSGVFGVARDIWDHPVLKGAEPFSKREAWMWLVSSAAWKSYRAGIAGRVVNLERGEFCFSVRFLEKKWAWKPGRVERFLNVLEKHDMIRDATRDSSKVYSISNYNEYQVVGLPNRDSDRDTDHDTTATGPRQDRDKEETFKHLNIEEEDTSSLRSDVRPPAEPVVPIAQTFALEPVTEIPEALDRRPEAQALRAYNDAAEEIGWSKAQRLTDVRRRALKARLRECGGIDGWRDAMAKARASPFLNGTGKRSPGHENWAPNIDFFLQPSTFTKLMEGSYDERSNAKADGLSGPIFEGAARAIARRRGARQAQQGVESPADLDFG